MLDSPWDPWGWLLDLGPCAEWRIRLLNACPPTEMVLPNPTLPHLLLAHPPTFSDPPTPPFPTHPSPARPTHPASDSAETLGPECLPGEPC